MANEKAYKTFGIIALVLLALYAVYYFFFKPASNSEQANTLGMLTGDLEADACLTDLMAIADPSGNGLEWELNDAANRLASPPPTQDYWLAGGKYYPAAALLQTMDITFDYYNGWPDSPTGPANIPTTAVDDYIALQNGPFGGMDADLAAQQVGYTVEQLEAAIAFQNGDLGPNPYTQATIGAMWGRFNAFKYLVEHPEAFSTASGLTDFDITINNQTKK